MAASGSYTQRFFILLEVLKHNTNADHTLSQVELVDLLAEQGIVIDRRSVKKALDEMIKLGYPIKYSQGWYFEHDFSTEELDALMSLIRCGSYFSAEDQRRLEEKIQNLGGKWYQPPESITPTKPTNPLLMHNLHVLYEAIRAGVQVNFTYGNWDIDKELHPRPNSVGKPKEYSISPYHIVTVNGRFYLIASANKHNNLCHFRIDRILEVKMRKKKAKSLVEISDGFLVGNIADYVAQHPYMHTGEAKEYRIRVKRSGINDVLDWFGTNVIFDRIRDTTVDALVVSDAASMEFWLRRYKEEADIVYI